MCKYSALSFGPNNIHYTCDQGLEVYKSMHFLCPGFVLFLLDRISSIKVTQHISTTTLTSKRRHNARLPPHCNHFHNYSNCNAGHAREHRCGRQCRDETCMCKCSPFRLSRSASETDRILFEFQDKEQYYECTASCVAGDIPQCKKNCSCQYGCGC